MNLGFLSSNVTAILGEILANKQLLNLIGWNGDQPSAASIKSSDIAGKKLLPYPFDITFKEDVRTQLHVYYASMEFLNNSKAGQSIICFDIVVHKSIWLLVDKGNRLVRPYEIAKQIVDTFKDKRVQGLGEIHFHHAEHVTVNEEFEGFRLVAVTTEF